MYILQALLDCWIGAWVHWERRCFLLWVLALLRTRVFFFRGHGAPASEAFGHLIRSEDYLI